MNLIRTYSELSKLTTFQDRFDYLYLGGTVGKETFGFDRIFNQMFYRSTEWKHIRHKIILRDLGCDLGIEGYEIMGQAAVVHHMNPFLLDDLANHSDLLLNPEYLITTTYFTHRAIHYSKEAMKSREFVERRPNDTCPWKK